MVSCSPPPRCVLAASSQGSQEAAGYSSHPEKGVLASQGVHWQGRMKEKKDRESVRPSQNLHLGGLAAGRRADPSSHLD